MRMYLAFFTPPKIDKVRIAFVVKMSVTHALCQLDRAEIQIVGLGHLTLLTFHDYTSQIATPFRQECNQIDTKTGFWI